MKKLFVIMMCILLVTGCGKKEEEQQADDYLVDIKTIMNEKEYVIVDVRTKEEYDELHVRNAINIPVETIDEKVSLDKDKNIFVYCKSGNRSAKAEEILKGLGYSVYNLGGINNLLIELDKVSTADMKVKKIVDKSKDNKDFVCAEALQEFYRDSKYTYSWSCMKDEQIVVIYNDDYEEKVSVALKNNSIKIKDLDKYKIKYIKQKNNS